MQQRLTIALLLLLAIVTAMPAVAQLRDQGLGAGVGIGAAVGVTDYTADKAALFTRGFLRFPFVKALQGEVGLGIGEISGPEYKGQILPIEFRLLVSPFAADWWNLYLYAGAGGVYNKLQTKPANADWPYDARWAMVIPGGLGLQVKLGEEVMLEGSAGYNLTFGRGLNGIVNDKTDNYMTGLLGLSFAGESGSADPDKDGLTNNEEKQLGTNKKVADTDGDGLPDGAEVKQYKTNPLAADSDNDGLKDGEEVRTYKTDANKSDTDGDGLSDGDESNKYRSDPLKADSDGDGLKDGDEVTKYKTDPLKADTDADGLKDGDEVTTHKTDPLKADTDAGTVNDGAEVARGSNPLDASDDVPKKETIKVEVGKSIVLEGIVFATGKATIKPESGAVLDQVATRLVENPDVAVEIRGHTDNTGKRTSNMKLSQARANSVRDYLIKKGVTPDRITAKGLGPDYPIGDNKTDAGRAMNRRIEFFRVK